MAHGPYWVDLPEIAPGKHHVSPAAWNTLVANIINWQADRHANGHGIDGLGSVGIGTTSPLGPFESVVRSVESAVQFNAAVFTGHVEGAIPDGFGIQLAFRLGDHAWPAAIGALIRVQKLGSPGIRYPSRMSFIVHDGNSYHESLILSPSGAIIFGMLRTPTSAGASGSVGELCFDSSYAYFCIAPNTWRRVALASW